MMRYLVFSLTLSLSAASAIQAAEPDASVSEPVSSEVSSFEVEVERGARRPLLDGVGWVIGVPNKLLLLDSRADNHDVSPKTIEETTEFLAANKVDGVKVRVNQYDPIGEWKRLATNDRIALPWRATVGAVYTLGYSIVPGRLVGGDWYNPFTDSVHVYSDVPALAMEQAAQAHDNHQRSHPGFYSAMRLFPIVGIVHEARSKQVVYDFVDKTGTTEEQAEARRVLGPQMGRELGQAAMFIPQGDAVLSLGGAAVGHVVGRYQAHQIESASVPASPTPPATANPAEPL